MAQLIYGPVFTQWECDDCAEYGRHHEAYYRLYSDQPNRNLCFVHACQRLPIHTVRKAEQEHRRSQRYLDSIN